MSSDRPIGLPSTGLADTGTPRGIVAAGLVGLALAAAGIYVWRKQ